MYQHGTIFSFNNRINVHLHGLDMRDAYTNSIIKVHYIWFYNVYKLYVLI